MNETERDILYEIRNIYVGGDGIILPRERLGVVVGYMVELEMRIRGLTAERDAARAENKRLRAACEDTADVIGWYLGDGDGLAALVDKYGSIREVRQVMKDKAAALRAALGIESEASE